MSAPLLPGAARVPKTVAAIVGAVVFLMVGSAISGSATPIIVAPVGVVFGLLTRAFVLSDERVERIRLGVALGIGVAALVIGIVRASTESEFERGGSIADVSAFVSLFGVVLGVGLGWLIGLVMRHRHLTPK